ncbi:fumarylacetoacetate hydrolase family protein [Aliifodinibius salicampi]|uniref:Fumarylacetoacetate hydrolase family protein n=1 Tax=Fodinibius salicampi TaxID=1920655 RepID=A0ABT3PU24_9BACT|nr:fumarylacetoacetate hydrolase family protein [Fodinibius salicampi]MCW9711356.1 fumarylacetoacetate hydrolase family protein [Fodinibius salicampi]
MDNITLKNLSGLSVGSVYCIGRNYVAHAHEFNNEVPDKPLVFLKPASSITYEGPIQLPKESTDVHHEVELVVALGKGGKNIPQEEALTHVAGYTVGIDITARDIQARAKEKGHPWSVAKGFETFAPLAPFVLAEEINDPKSLELSLKVNDELRQKDSTNLMIFSVSDLISYLSTIFRLRPGDLLFTGTPKGVSPLHQGDHIEAAISQPSVQLKMEVI